MKEEQIENNNINQKEQNTKFFSDDIRERQRKQRSMALLWPILSFILHLVGFALLVIFTPLREIIIPEKQPQPSMLSQISIRELEEIAEDIEQARENEIAQYLMELQTILHNMEYMKNELLKSFDEFAKQEAEQVKPEIEQLFDKVLEKQERSVELQVKTEKMIDEVVQLEKQQPVTAIVEAVEKKVTENEEALKEIEENQAIAQNLLDVITAKAQITEMKKTAEATELARKAQLEINDFQAEARQKLFEVRSNTAHLKNVEDRIKQEQKYQEEKAKPELEAAKVEAKKKQEELKQAEQEFKQAEQTFQEVKKQADASQKERKDAQHQVNVKRNARDKVQRELKHAERVQSNRQKSLEKSISIQVSKQEEFEKLKKENQERVEKLDKLDDEISKSQKELIERVKEIAALAKNEAPKPEPRADESISSPELANVTLTYLPLAEAYDKAKELEKQIAEKNRDIKATELAINQKMSLQMAEAITDVAKTERPDFQKELLNTTPKTEKEFVEKREEMTKVVRETEDILEKSINVMNEAMALIEPQQHGADFADSDDDRLKRMNDFAELANEIAEAGSEDEQETAKDLAELMRQADALAAMQELPEEAYDMEAEEDAKGRSSVPGATTGVSEIAKLETGMEGLEPGNIYGSSGVPAIWGFVNSWYVIGPFDNPNRVNITRKFAPESVVDLDASYIGKGGKTVRWEYVQATATKQDNHWLPSTAKKSMVLPEYSGEYEIWYAYTEIFMEEECDLWLGIGSDDRSDIWLNDFKIWSSSNKLKAWRIDEGFRRVHLRKGRNKILARIENGHWNFGWSICLTPDGSAIAK